MQNSQSNIQNSLTQSLQESFSDVSGNLNNEKNPFIKADNSNKLSQSNISLNNNEAKKRGKYVPRDPIHDYYLIEGKLYKYTCKKNILKIIYLLCIPILHVRQKLYIKK